VELSLFGLQERSVCQFWGVEANEIGEEALVERDRDHLGVGTQDSIPFTHEEGPLILMEEFAK